MRQRERRGAFCTCPGPVQCRCIAAIQRDAPVTDKNEIIDVEMISNTASASTAGGQSPDLASHPDSTVRRVHNTRSTAGSMASRKTNTKASGADAIKDLSPASGLQAPNAELAATQVGTTEGQPNRRATVSDISQPLKAG